ncbi:hypothetical protein V6N11_040170 [Hibiscus sabdariffa]|uniref:DUF4283 domain-containing protein n=1 Tax=Hibiscus sabdariffa TaxID=183260 RepID=A0ABR2RGP3_9ROSI
MEVISRCSIGRYRFPISNSDLTEALRLEKVGGVRVMRIFGSSVLLIFDDEEARQRVMESDMLSNWFDHVVDWNEAESAMVNRRVWLSVYGVPIHAWASGTFKRLVAHWGSVIQVAEATVELSSFERGRVLIETTSLDRIEECVELRVKDKIFPIRIAKAETFLRGPRCSYVCTSHRSNLESSDSEHGD